MQEPDIIAVAVACIKNGEIFMVRNSKGFWLLPGGKMEPQDEGSELTCLRREIAEELPNVHLHALTRWHEFFGRIREGGKIMLVIYFADISGDFTPAAEIECAQWASAPESLKLLGATRRAIQQMRTAC